MIGQSLPYRRNELARGFQKRLAAEAAPSRGEAVILDGEGVGCDEAVGARLDCRSRQVDQRGGVLEAREFYKKGLFLLPRDAPYQSGEALRLLEDGEACGVWAANVDLDACDERLEAAVALENVVLFSA